MRAQGFVVWSWAVAVGWLAGGCFKPALEREVDGEDSSEVADTDDTAESPPDSVPDTVSDTVEPQDAADTNDTNDADTSTPLDTADSLEPDVAPSCSVDGECVGLARPPCVVGRCVAQRCAAVDVSVPCDDGDVCTTADQCQAGVCVGRTFTAEEAKSWIVRLGGAGQVGVVDHVVHASGDLTVVGALSDRIDIAGRSPLQAEGGFDAFLIRYLARGDIVQAFAWGGDGDDAPLMAAEAGEDTRLVWAERAEGATTPTFWLGTHRRQDEEVRGSEVPGFPLAIDALPEGGTLYAAQVVGTATIPNEQGGSTVLDELTHNAFVANMAYGTASWVLPIRRFERELGIHVVAMGEEAFVIVGLAGGGGLGALGLVEAEEPAGYWSARISIESGAVLEVRPFGGDAQYVSSVERFGRADTVIGHLRIDLDNELVVLRSTQGGSPWQVRCERTIELGGADLVFGREVPASAGRALGLYATAGAAFEVEPGVGLSPGPHQLAVAVYGSDCRPERVLALNLRPADEQPPEIASVGAARLSFSTVQAATNGRAVISGPLREALQPGAVFGEITLTPADGSDEAYLGSIGPADLHGCRP